MSLLIAVLLVAALLQLAELQPGVEYGTTAGLKRLFGMAAAGSASIRPGSSYVGLASREKVGKRTAGQRADSPPSVSPSRRMFS